MSVSMNLASSGSDNGLLVIQRHAIIWTNAGLLSIGPLGINFSAILIKIPNFSFTKMHLQISSAKWWPFCPGGDELNANPLPTVQCWYNTVSFLQNTHNRHPVTRPWGWDMGCFLWVQAFINVLPWSLQWYHHQVIWHKIYNGIQLYI